MSNANPRVSIIIVNYNQRDMVIRCLKALFKIEYPKSKYEVIVVDNNSQDDSAQKIREQFPRVKLISSPENLGFAQGVNLGAQEAEGDYIVLLNNDIIVEKDWLRELVAPAHKDGKVGLVCSKLYFSQPYIEVELNSTVVLQSEIDDSGEFNAVGVTLESVHCAQMEDFRIWHLDGFYPPTKPLQIHRITNGQAHLLVPVPDTDQVDYYFTLQGAITKSFSTSEIELKVSDAKHTSVETIIESREIKQLHLQLKTNKLTKHKQWLVQNAGNVIFRTGHGRDRGAVIKREPHFLAEFYDFDSEYYQQPTALLGAAGASCLIRKSTFDQVGGFNPNFFMYYEDMEFSLTARKLGWKIHYQPTSIAYHHHRLSTNTMPTSFFIKQVELNHLQFVLVHFPLPTVVLTTLRFFGMYFVTKLFYYSLRLMSYYGYHFQEYHIKNEARSASMKEVWQKAKAAWSKRSWVRAHQVVTQKQLKPHMY